MADLDAKKDSLKSEISDHKKLKNKCQKAIVFRQARLASQRASASLLCEFEHNTAAATDAEFDRDRFVISKKDYRRGNAIDNYFRVHLSDLAISAFSGHCLVCGSSQSLTLDHYGLAKNEGGNLVLLLKDGVGFRMNFVVLCQGCNSAKSDRDYRMFFSADQIKLIHDVHVTIARRVASDVGLRENMKKHYRDILGNRFSQDQFRW
ncbi:MAG: hypothetical protein H6810_00135 [Phycisphaeraceae bacterium]|nr:MAG: hypothetical protein H6810_00135 [Phycisphaeraceae bacterium]